MRLTRVLNVIFPKKRKQFGLTYEGRNQTPLPVKTSMKVDAVYDIIREEQNNQYLREAYLSQQDEELYGQHHPEKKREKFLKFKASHEKPFYPNRTLDDHFKNLNLNKKWE